MPDPENPSASVHRKRFSTSSLTLKFLCAGKLNPREKKNLKKLKKAMKKADKKGTKVDRSDIPLNSPTST
jgi:hypothetical protein